MEHIKMVAFDEIRDNEYFWLYFLSTAFPLAMDVAEDINLNEFIDNNYDCETDASEWVDSFVQYTEEVMDDGDGYVDEPNAISVSVENEEYIIEYHPGDTLYFQNGKLIASTGPEYEVHVITFEHFRHLTEKIDDFFKAILILPLVYVEQSEEAAAKELVNKLIEELPIYSWHRSLIADMIIEGLKV